MIAARDRAFGRTIRLATSLVWGSGRRLLIVIVVATVVTSIATAGQLLVGRKLLDLIAGDERVTAGELAPYLALLGGLLAVSALTQTLANELRAPLSELVFRRAMADVLDVAVETDIERFEDNTFHDQLRRARSAAGGQSAAVVFGLVNIVSTLVIAAGVVIVLLTVAPILVPVAVVGYVPIALVNAHNNKARYELERDTTELQRERAYVEFLMSDRSTAAEVRAYGLGPTFRRWHDGLWESWLQKLQSLVRRRIVLNAAAALVTTAVLVGTLSFALILAGRGTISIGDAAVAIVGLQQLSSRLRSTGAAVSGVHEGVTFLRDFDQFRSLLPEIRASRQTVHPPMPPTVLTVRDLGYRYPGATTDAVRSVSFEVRRGQSMAIVGANGSGKSTLSKLICNLLPPTHGAISWDGVDIATCDPLLVRQQIAVVFQDYTNYLFTVRRAIGLGDVWRMEDAEAIERAATLAGVDDLLSAHADRLDVRLGKEFSAGIDISIGQWQRIAIARALFRDAPIVVMDEPSASLDPRAETNLFDLLQQLCDDRIVIFISHRFATVRAADLVLVLDQGEVVESGSHDQLMHADGLYAELFRVQADRYGLR